MKLKRGNLLSFLEVKPGSASRFDLMNERGRKEKCIAYSMIKDD